MTLLNSKLYFLFCLPLLFLNTHSFSQKKSEKISNMRETYKEIDEQFGLNPINSSETTNPSESPSFDTVINNISYLNFTRYRRNSLYTLVTNNEKKHCNIPFINGFGNNSVTISEKYNYHNLSLYQVPINENINVGSQIESYLIANNVAKDLIAKWFRRSKSGTFDMKLVAQRGEYDASFLERSIAEKTVRGTSMLKDAGEELLAQTYVLVYDFHHTDMRKSFKIDVDVYVYRLVWDDATANLFFTNYWIDRHKTNPQKKQAFENSTEFKMRAVGVFKSLTSVVIKKNFDSKEYESTYGESRESNLIAWSPEIMPVLMKNSFLKLEEKIDEFRTKFTLFSGNPIAAKIGTKEDLKVGDKFEVLEKIYNSDGSISYKRIGIIRLVDSNKIWDNNTKADWTGGSRSNLEYTEFEGDINKYAPGMFIRKMIN